MITLIPPMIFTGLDFGEFKGDSRPASRSQEFNNNNNNSNNNSSNNSKGLENETIPDRKISTSPVSIETSNEGKI